jgi:hypothetical protein
MGIEFEFPKNNPMFEGLIQRSATLVEIHHKHSRCRVCRSTDLLPFLELGPTPLANSFLEDESDFAGEKAFPLDVYFCENCSLVQILDVIDPEVLFRDYIYVTGTSDTMAIHNRNYARSVVDLMDLGERDLVVEIASNDGSLLKHFQGYGVRVLGVEPAVNIARLAEKSGVPTANLFFNSDTASKIRQEYGPARAVIGNNVLAHVDEVQDFLIGIKHLLAPDGRVVVEVPYLKQLLDHLEYDTIYHEHLSYFTVTSLIRLFDEVGLSILNVEPVPVHGGSLRVYAGLPDFFASHEEAVIDQAKAERHAGLQNPERYHQFASDVESNRRNLVGLLEQLRSKGKSLAGYGAPAKGNTLLNYCRITTELIPYTVDKNPFKVGKLTPGMHIPVFPVETLIQRQPDYVLILAWNFADEIIRQQDTYRQRGGQFILPLPEPKVIR